MPIPKNPTIKVEMSDISAEKSPAERLADFDALVEGYKIQNPVKYKVKKEQGDFDRQRAIIQGKNPTPLKIVNPPQESKEEITGEKEEPKEVTKEEPKKEPEAKPKAPKPKAKKRKGKK
uniref:Uncharacterized protein n=1 Tax=viral metagenome TaxID=1070528 RepID=A0A6H1ZQS8_9ZZZZ